jgi:hypothetical protein
MINEDKAPKDMLERLNKVNSEDLPKLLTIVFLATAEKLKMFEKMNEHNSYATVVPVTDNL